MLDVKYNQTVNVSYKFSHIRGCRQLEIRPVSLNDAEKISQIRRKNEVREGILALTSERTETTAQFISSIAEDDRAYVALENGEITGLVVLVHNRTYKRTHSGVISIMVDTEFQNIGIGTALMRKVVNAADRELKLHRLELLVLSDNKHAIRLYEKFGFIKEGTRKHAAVKDGAFIDEDFFARVAASEA